MPIPPLPAVAGTRLDGPGFTITPEENAALCASIAAPIAPDGQAHPVWSYVATQIGMGMSVAELCATCDFDVDDGPMMAWSRAEWVAPLLTGRHYDVTGEILSLTRKPSRKLGVMDLLEYRLELRPPGAAPVCTVTNAWVLPMGPAMLPDIGTKLAPLRVASVDPAVMRAWAPLLRDPNPIHLDRAAVQARGLGDRLINQGPINMAWLTDMVTSAFPGARLDAVAYRFNDNVYEADALQASGEVVAVDADTRRVTCRIALAVAGRGDAVTGEAILTLPKET